LKEKSQADLLRDRINLQLDQKFDFSQSSNVTADIQSFCKANESRNWNVTSVRPSYNRILAQCAKNKKITLEHLGKKTKAPKFNKRLQSTITAKPVGKTIEGTAPAQPTQGAQTILPTGQPAQQFVNFDSEGVAATFNALFISIRIAYPELEALTKEEKDSLGKMWLPAFQRYLTENWAFIGIPFIATLGIMLPKVAEARKKHKANKEEASTTSETKGAQAETEERKKQKQKQQSDIEQSGIRCRYCNELFKNFVDLKDHTQVCPQRKKKQPV